MKSLKIVLSLGIAVSAGILIGVLTAPRKGKQTRTKLIKDLDNKKDAFESAASKKLEEAKRMVMKAAEKQHKTGKEAVNRIKEMVNS